MTSSKKTKNIEEKTQHIALAIQEHFASDGNDNILYHKGWLIDKLINGEEIEENDRMALLTADCQSGKTQVIIALSFIYMSLGLTPVVVLRRNTSDYLQISSRLRTEFDKLNSYLVETGIKYSKKLRRGFKNIVYIDSKNQKTKEGRKMSKQMGKILKGKRKGLVISLAEPTQMKRLNKILDEHNGDNKIALFIDEADMNGGYNQGEETAQPKAVNVRKLVGRSARFVAVTATGQDILVHDPKLYSDNIICKKAGSEYRGFDSIRFKDIGDVKPSGMDDEVIPEHIGDVLEKLSEKKHIWRRDIYGNKSKNPVMCLFKFTRLVDSHQDFLETFSRKMTRRRARLNISQEWAVLTYNGKGIKLFHPSLVGKNVVVDGVTSKEKESIHYFPPSVMINEVLQYLTDNGGVDIFHHIAIIGWDLADRGISFTNVTRNWHLTDMVYIPSLGSKSSNRRQASSRLFGNHGDDVELGLHTTKKCWEDIVKDWKAYGHFISTLSSISSNSNHQVSSRIAELPVLDGRLPKKFIGYVSGKAITFNVCPNPRKELEDKMLISAKKISDMRKIRWNPSEKIMKSYKKQYERLARDKDAQTRNKIHDLLLSKKNTKISVFLAGLRLDDKYTRKSVLNKLKDAGYKQPGSLFASISKPGSKYGPGYIFEKVGTSFRVRDGVKNGWKM